MAEEKYAKAKCFMLRYLRLEGDLKSNVHFQPAGWLSHIDALKMSGVLTHRECIRPPFQTERRSLL